MMREIDIDWRSGDGPKWLDALEIPAHAWAKTYFDPMHFPVGLWNKQQLLLDIFTKAKHKQADLWQAMAGVGHSPALNVAVTKEFITPALVQIETEAGARVRKEFEDWAFFYFVREEFAGALFVWRTVLYQLCRTSDTSEIQIKLFQSSERKVLEQDVCSLINHDYDSLEARLQLVSPPSERERAELGLDLSSDALKIMDIIRGVTTMTTLNKLRDAFSKEELSELVFWAEEQAQKKGMSPESLLADQILHG